MCSEGFKFQHQTMKYWTKIGLRLVMSQKHVCTTRPLNLIMSTEKMYIFSRWMWLESVHPLFYFVNLTHQLEKQLEKQTSEWRRTTTFSLMMLPLWSSFFIHTASLLFESCVGLCSQCVIVVMSFIQRGYCVSCVPWAAVCLLSSPAVVYGRGGEALVPCQPVGGFSSGCMCGVRRHPVIARAAWVHRS